MDSAANTDFRPLGDSADLVDQWVNPYYVEDKKLRIAVARVEGKLYAFDDMCTHENCPLSAGLLTGTTIMCQCHGSQFDITTGAVLRGPATTALGVYDVDEADGTIRARV